MDLLTNVLIVDDERIVQELFSYYIKEARKRYHLVDCIKNADNAQLYCINNKVDLILMDVCTANDESGLKATAEIKQKYPEVKVLITTSAPDYRFLEKAKEAGADSFWYKEVESDKLIEVMDRTMAGESVFPEETPTVKLGWADSTELTPKELEVLSYLVQNKGLHEIAERMGVDYSTTRTHIKNLKQKTGVNDIVGLCYLVAKSRLILPEF